MRPQPKVAKRCRLSEGCRRKDAWARIGFGASDPSATLANRSAGRALPPPLIELRFHRVVMHEPSGAFHLANDWV
jgi:hypothetical protein